MSERKRESTGFLIKQRAFLKIYLITQIQQGRPYGLQLLEHIKEEFKPLGFEPNHAEVYRALHELMEAGILKRGKEVMEGKKYQEIAVYSIADPDKAKAYKELAKADLDRCQAIIKKSIRDNYA